LECSFQIVFLMWIRNPRSLPTQDIVQQILTLLILPKTAWITWSSSCLSHHAHSVLLWWQSWISKWQKRQLCWVQMKRLQHVDKGILNKYILKASVSTTFYFTQRAIKSNGNILFVNEIWTAVSKIQLYMSLYLNNMLIGVCILLFMHRLCSIQFSFWGKYIVKLFV
jgi:hypothetical protein